MKSNRIDVLKLLNSPLLVDVIARLAFAQDIDVRDLHNYSEQFTDRARNSLIFFAWELESEDRESSGVGPAGAIKRGPRSPGDHQPRISAPGRLHAARASGTAAAAARLSGTRRARLCSCHNSSPQTDNKDKAGYARATLLTESEWPRRSARSTESQLVTFSLAEDKYGSGAAADATLIPTNHTLSGCRRVWNRTPTRS
ncbi:hypothetical protein EVAR_50611_1 [Eumeta japonica]|uniref:Uncharacterized protein n=1 Tax=Eumeta variegata TaxID=151549 RepID=A0A4C1Y5P3_EUMVA|nr:hypothetical protein EVAR_50611_1 [Eumeta japonica]